MLLSFQSVVFVEAACSSTVDIFRNPRCLHYRHVEVKLAPDKCAGTLSLG